MGEISSQPLWSLHSNQWNQILNLHYLNDRILTIERNVIEEMYMGNECVYMWGCDLTWRYMKIALKKSWLSCTLKRLDIFWRRHCGVCSGKQLVKRNQIVKKHDMWKKLEKAGVAEIENEERVTKFSWECRQGLEHKGLWAIWESLNIILKARESHLMIWSRRMMYHQI